VFASIKNKTHVGFHAFIVRGGNGAAGCIFSAKIKGRVKLSKLLRNQRLNDLLNMPCNNFIVEKYI